LHCDSVASATKIYESFVQLFGLPKKVKNFHSVCEVVRSYGSEREESDSDNDDLSDDSEDNINNDVPDGSTEECALSEAEKEATSATKNSPYWKIFHAIEMKVLRDSTCTNTENDFFSQKFLRYVGDILMPCFPLCSAMILTKVGLYRDSNAAIENYYKILKHYKFVHKKRMPASRFLMQNFEFIKGGLKERKFSLKTTRQTRKRNKDRQDNPVESWKK